MALLPGRVAATPYFKRRHHLCIMFHVPAAPYRHLHDKLTNISQSIWTCTGYLLKQRKPVKLRALGRATNQLEAVLFYCLTHSFDFCRMFVYRCGGGGSDVCTMIPLLHVIVMYNVLC